MPRTIKAQQCARMDHITDVTARIVLQSMANIENTDLSPDADLTHDILVCAPDVDEMPARDPAKSGKAMPYRTEEVPYGSEGHPL